jgi:hypothetical protein
MLIFQFNMQYLHYTGGAMCVAILQAQCGESWEPLYPRVVEVGTSRDIISRLTSGKQR